MSKVLDIDLNKVTGDLWRNAEKAAMTTAAIRSLDRL
jgi:hypothetical protein